MIQSFKNQLGAFPLKLYEMLEDAEQLGFDHIISWIPNGTGFRVHKPDELVEQILPKYFNQQTRYKSFQRQMNMYEFKMLRKAARGSYEEQFKGAIFHPLFVRGKKELCTMIVRKSIPRNSFRLANMNNINTSPIFGNQEEQSLCGFPSVVMAHTTPVTPGSASSSPLLCLNPWPYFNTNNIEDEVNIFGFDSSSSAVESQSWYKEHADCLLDYATAMSSSRPLHPDQRHYDVNATVELKSEWSCDKKEEKEDLFACMQWHDCATDESDDVIGSIISVFGSNQENCQEDGVCFLR